MVEEAGKASDGAPEPVAAETSGRIRLRTLVLIRWVAVAGQAGTLFAVHYGLAYTVPLVPAFVIVAASALFNLTVSVGRPPRMRLSARTAAVHLGYDILQVSALLLLTGGLQNPFAVLILAPVIVSATVLPRGSTIALGLFTGICITALALFHLPVPLGEPFNPPVIYIAGIWEALISAVLFIGIYVGSVAEEARRMSDALAATQMALAREQQLSALGALAAAAAHELGSPLSTIAVTAQEMKREVPTGGSLADDIELLISQSERCREILAGLAHRPEADAGSPFSRLPVSVLIEAAAEPHRDDAIELIVDAGPAGDDGAPEPVVARSPEIIHGLGNLIQNAIQHARKRVVIDVRWSADEVTVTVDDDGPGFSPLILDRLGEPYISDNRGRRRKGDEHMGLGIFIARTLLARTGASIRFGNRPGSGKRSGGGAQVAVGWPRSSLEITEQGRMTA